MPDPAPENTLRPQDAQRIGLDKDLCARNAELLHQHPEIREKSWQCSHNHVSFRRRMMWIA